jgi:betaine-aldehyde dehydrogenase
MTTRVEAQRQIDSVELAPWIDGAPSAPAGSETLAGIAPATGEEIFTVAAGAREEIDAAVAAATEALRGAWGTTPVPARARLIYRLADLIERDSEKLVAIQTLENGTPMLGPQTVDLPVTIDLFRYYAGWADKIGGETIPTGGYMGRPTHAYTVREPVGVVGAIVPWNAPLLATAMKLAPALACGCTVVVKPAEEAMVPVLHLAALATEAGFPDGTINVVPGRGEVAGAALAAHPGVAKVSFTGSPPVGREIQRLAADRFARVTLELGGKSPQIVFADAHLPDAIAGCAMGLFANQGQVCLAGTRILVQRPVYEAVVEALGEAAGGVVVGDPFDPGTQMGALISDRQMDRVLGYVDAGRKEGATVVAGGERVDRPGYFVAPTILADAGNESRIAREEIFGPVGLVMPFDEIEEALATANDSVYGLAATVWTQNLGTARAMVKGLRVGAIGVNAWSPLDPRVPHGGTKGSGIGRENGRAALDEFTELKTVTVLA